MMHIGIDVMGGDYAPGEVVKGVKHFQENASSTDKKQTLHLIGPQDITKKLLIENNIADSKHINVVHSFQIIDFNDSPTKALKEKPYSSISIGFQMLASNKLDAFIGSGNTGAMLVGAHTNLKLIPGILRPAIGVLFPRDSEQYNLLLDVGSNVECRPEQMNQLAVVGSVYMEVMFNKKKPLVGLLNVGEEPNKGSAAYIESHDLLSKNEKINFLGNIEGRDILSDKADIILCDGFIGNIVLKLMESTYKLFGLANNPKKYLQEFNFEVQGGVPVLGVNKPVVIGHGVSTGLAFSNMIFTAMKLVRNQFCSNLEKALE